MAWLALVLVLVSAIGHALWNLLAKTALKTEAFIWWMLVVRTLLILPFYVLGMWSFEISLAGLLAASVSSVLWVGYFASLSNAYDCEDFSVIYPIARSFPLFVPIWATTFLGERLSPLGFAGILVTSLGTYMLQMKNPSRELFEPLRALQRRGPLLALAAAVLASVAAVVDKWGVNVSSSSAFTVWSFIAMALAYTPYVLRNRSRSSLTAEWAHGPRQVLLGGFFGSFYALILWAFPMTQVSYIQGIRQISIVFGAVIGIWWLRERNGAVRIFCSALICFGVVILSLT